MITQDAETGDELERRNLVKGYEFRKNQYLLLSNGDLDSVSRNSSTSIPSTRFTTMLPITRRPMATDAGRDVYAVLREAIAKTGKVALSRVVISQRERTIALRPADSGLIAHTLYEDRDLNSGQELFEGMEGIKVNQVERQVGSAAGTLAVIKCLEGCAPRATTGASTGCS